MHTATLADLAKATDPMETTDPFRVAIRERVSRGINLLDLECVNWRWRIRHFRVDIRRGTTDVLGLLYTGYLTGLERLGVPRCRAAHYGFTPVDGEDPVEILVLNNYWNYLKDWRRDPR